MSPSHDGYVGPKAISKRTVPLGCSDAMKGAVSRPLGPRCSALGDLTSDKGGSFRMTQLLTSRNYQLKKSLNHV